MENGDREGIAGCEPGAEELDEFCGEVIAGIMLLAGTGGVENYFGEPVDWENISEPDPHPAANSGSRTH